eukprot:6171864-Pleurochrysis_carterae.AAC.1
MRAGACGQETRVHGRASARGETGALNVRRMRSALPNSGQQLRPCQSWFTNSTICAARVCLCGRADKGATQCRHVRGARIRTAACYLPP